MNCCGYDHEFEVVKFDPETSFQENLDAMTCYGWRFHSFIPSMSLLVFERCVR